MEDINFWAIVAAVIASFVTSSIYYVVFSKQWASVSKVGAAAAEANAKHPGPFQGIVQIARTLVLTFVVAFLVSNLHIHDAASAIGLSFILWVGFPVVLLTGSVMWEKSPVKLAMLHAGDSLLALLIMTLVLSLWR
ncbi:MAG TPA: DUF1761 domain-containing protein [Candidatus Saccharimonadales bacterium]|nr:DUF1761 domain-containing protein [Candidatus Saccharimonadales bacterium]